MAAVEQLSLFDRAEEARAYHDPARAGFFSILVNDQGEKKQSSHRLIEMPTVLELIDKTRDTWMTQAEFIRPNRRVVNLARIGLLFADLDRLCCKLFSRIDVCLSLVTVMLRVPQRPGMAIDCR